MLSKCVVHKARRAAVLEAQGHHKARHAAVLECSGHSQVGKRGAGPADSTSGPWMIGETVKRGARRADSASEPWKLNETGKRGASQAGSASGPSKKDNTKHAKRQCSRQEFNTSMRSKCAVHKARRAAVLEAQGQHKARHAAVLECNADSTTGPWKKIMGMQAVLR